MRSTKFLIFITALTFMLNQTRILGGSSWLSAGRWVLLGCYCIVIVLRSFSRRRFRKPRVVDTFTVAFLSLSLLSTTYSASPDVTWQRTLSSILLYIAIFWVTWDYADAAGEESVIEALFYAAAIIYGTSILLLPMSSLTWQVDGRFRGVMINPNSLGLLTGIFLPLVIWRVMRYKHKIDMALLGAMIICVLLSASRNGVLVSLVGTVYLLHKLGVRKSIKTGLIVLATVSWVYFSLSDTALNLSQTGAESPLTRLLPSTENIGTGGGRTEIWTEVLPLIEAELLWGHGFGTEDIAVKDLEADFAEFQGGYFHNSYLGLTYQLGIVGACLFFGPLYWLLFRKFWLRNRGVEIPLSPALQAVLLAGLIAAFFESWIYSVGNAFSFPFWICVMLLARSKTLKPKSVSVRMRPVPAFAQSKSSHHPVAG